jgi:hypothetical protein
MTVISAATGEEVTGYLASASWNPPPERRPGHEVGEDLVLRVEHYKKSRFL